MVHSFFLFYLLKNKPIIEKLSLNPELDLNYSQFKLDCHVDSKKIDLPILSFVDSDLAVTKIKIYDYMSKEIRKKGKTADNVVVSMFMYRYNRIDLSRLIIGMGPNDYLLEFVQDCDTSIALYCPIIIFDHIKNAEQLAY